MDEREPRVLSSEGLATSPIALPKAPSWARNPRTSCDSCKQMKIKCQREGDQSCARCIARKLDCRTTPVERKKPKLTKDAHLHEMENRLNRMESVINTFGRPATAELVEEKDEENGFSDKFENQAELSNQFSSLIINPKEPPMFIGWASGFSLLSPQGLRWISERVGNKDELAQLVHKISTNDDGAWGRRDVDLWHPIPRSQHLSLPSKDLALQYVNRYFITFNNVFPLINQRVFNSYFERQYSTSPPASSAWYALFNAVLCLGSMRIKGEQEWHIRNSCLIDYTSITNETGSEYFRNASSCFLDLLFKEANLMAMQAMTLMLFITTSSPNPQPAYIITSAAGNLANTLGLHRRLDGFSLAPEEIEQRRNVFWVFYLMEKAISHNLGRPSVINDDDIAVELPPKKPGLVQSPSGAKFYDIFQDQIMLAIIGSRICSELYSASSQTKSEMDRMKVLGKLDHNLQRWRDAIPIDIRPEHPIKCSDEQFDAVVMMHFTYLDAVILLHRVSVHRESFKDGEVTDMKSHEQRQRLNPRVYASQLLCLAAARRSVQLLDTINNNNLKNQHFMWMALYYPLSAGLFLFANILSNPQDQRAASDIQLMSVITSFITQYVQPGTSFATTPTVRVFKELFIIATRLVARVSPQPSQKSKRLCNIDEPAHSDFISSSRVQLASNRSLCSDLEIQITKSLISHDAPATYSDVDIPVSSTSPTHRGQQVPQGDQDVQSTASTEYSREPTSTNLHDFAPSIPSEPDPFDRNPTIYDSLLSPTIFEYDMANMWMPDFTPDSWTLADLMELPADSSLDYGQGYINENDDGNNSYQL